MAEIFIRFLIGLVGIGIGICIGYFASAHLLARTYDAEKELKKVRDERNYFEYLLTQVSPLLPKTEYWEDLKTETTKTKDSDYISFY